MHTTPWFAINAALPPGKNLWSLVFLLFSTICWKSSGSEQYLSAAIPLALIVNELITNAYKHAFTNKKEGAIEILLVENNKQIFLTIKDNGQGFDKTVIPKNSIGMDILAGLIEQINGICNLTSDEKGTQYKISFSKK